MIRVLLFLVLLAAVAGAAAWFADHPGRVSVTWQGWRIDTSVGFLAFAVALLVVVGALIDRAWRMLRRAPGAIARGRREDRRGRGYRALIPVAAGDAGEARRQAKRVERLLGEPPLAMLLSARTAELAGDEAAAERLFTAMLDHPETEFLGLKGLVTQARRKDARAEALELAHRAYRLKPETPWVLTTLFDLQARDGRWQEALATLEEAIRWKAVDAADGRRRKAVVLHELSGAAQAAGETRDALERARKAHDLAPEFVPAAVHLAALLVQAGQQRRAARVVERAWARAPHPDLAKAYAGARPAADALERVKRLQKLEGLRPGHLEGRVALGEAALEAELWGEARRYLDGAAGAGPQARVCRLMARLEEAAHGDAGAASRWLGRAAEAAPGPAWICRRCSAATLSWRALCERCGAFDSLAWRSPGPAAALALGAERPPPPAAPAFQRLS
ncbi:MAG: heme biosynthesis protein HemY [Alphaproteobacteria bacterium]